MTAMTIVRLNCQPCTLNLDDSPRVGPQVGLAGRIVWRTSEGGIVLRCCVVHGNPQRTAERQCMTSFVVMTAYSDVRYVAPVSADRVYVCVWLFVYLCVRVSLSSVYDDKTGKEHSS